MKLTTRIGEIRDRVLAAESSDVRDEQIPNHRVEKSPNNIDRCRGEPLAGRFGKGTLKGASHRAGDKVRDSVCRENAPKEIRHNPMPIHNAELLFSNNLFFGYKVGSRFNPQPAA